MAIPLVVLWHATACPLSQAETWQAGVARVNITMSTISTPLTRYPNALRLKLSFLSNPVPFESLIGISERAVHAPELADELFPVWLERNETMYTNTVPMRWIRDAEPPLPGPRRRRI